ncbi:hypothetical protein PLUTE_a4114 [Pseudoalteromonas luteoviolacea DSM 6061]|nr:hypothetical protein [Pseudoalteromonas luteoviolacea DSM 6061]
MATLPSKITKLHYLLYFSQALSGLEFSPSLCHSQLLNNYNKHHWTLDV